MRDTFKFKLLKVALATAFLSTSVSNVYAGACLPSTNTDVCIEETNSGSFGSYSIQNDGEVPIFAFGVTNPSSTLALTENAGWAALSLTQTQWDAGQTFNFYTGSEDFSPSAFIRDEFPTASTTTNVLGTYADLFGTEETTVNFYWQEAYPALLEGGFELIPLLADGTSINGFNWNTTQLFSNFVAFDLSGNIAARTPMTTTPSAVPVPAALPLMASALGLFGIARRQKNK